jgi:membrane protein implicated in regulation of membrane protease activity
MTMTPDVIWLILGVLLLIVEVMTGGFWIGFFGIGAIVTSALVWSSVIQGMNGQIAAFLGFSGLPLILLRKSLVRWLDRKAPGATVGDATGQTAVVVQEIAPDSVGRVEYQGSTWDAESQAGERLPEQTRVRIMRQDGTRLYVRRV